VPESADEFELPPPAMLPISPDFVDRTFARVLADRRQLAAEAARVDEIRFDPRDLAEWRVPVPSVLYPARLLAAWRAELRPLPQVARYRRPAAWAAVAAAAALALFLLAREWLAPAPRPDRAEPIAVEFTAAPWGAKLARLEGIVVGRGVPDSLAFAAEIGGRERPR
jgi:hypothetical protein